MLLRPKNLDLLMKQLVDQTRMTQLQVMSSDEVMSSYLSSFCVPDKKSSQEKESEESAATIGILPNAAGKNNDVSADASGDGMTE